MYEIEAKFRVEDLPLLEATLAALGYSPGVSCEEIDRFFQHPARNFAETDECLRFRRRILDQGNIEQSITYKGPKTNCTTGAEAEKRPKTRREIEVPIAEPVDSWAELFEALGFRESARVRKFRRYGKLRFDDQERIKNGCEVVHGQNAATNGSEELQSDVQYAQEVEIVLDELPDLGQTFIELEIIVAENASPTVIDDRQRTILDLARKLRLGEQIHASYLAMTMRRQ